MVQVLPTLATFSGGEGQQDTATFYIHGSLDGGQDTYSVGGAPAIWDGADGGIGIDNPDTALSFAGHENDDAGTGGPYSTRLGGLLLRPQLPAGEDYEVEIAFQFRGTAKGEKVAVFARTIPDNLTGWTTRGVNGTRKTHYFTKSVQGIGLEIDDSGAAVLFFYSSAGARVNIVTGTVAVGTTTHTLTLLVSGIPGTVTPKLDGSSPFAAGSYNLLDGTASSRGHAAFALTRTQAADYPISTAFQVRDFVAPLSPITILRDEWTRSPDLTGTIIPTASVPNNIDLCPHKLFEWGGNRIAAIGATPVGPYINKGTKRFGPQANAAGMAGTSFIEWLDIDMAGAATATQVVSMVWEYSMLPGIIGGNVAIGVAARATKSTLDPGADPTLANSTAYIFRFVFASPLPYFELVRLNAGVETRLEQIRPMNLFSFQSGDIHTFSLKVEDSGPDPVLDATWTDHMGIVFHMYTGVVDSAAGNITAAGGAGIYAKISPHGGTNPAFSVTSLRVSGTSIPPPTTVTEAIVFGPVPFVPEFSEKAQDVYRTLQRVSDRLYLASHREFIEPRTLFTASWLLPDADALTMSAFLLARNKDRQAMTITIDGVARNLVATSSEFDMVKDAGGFQRIGPITMMEVL